MVWNEVKFIHQHSERLLLKRAHRGRELEPGIPRWLSENNYQWERTVCADRARSGQVLKKQKLG